MKNYIMTLMLSGILALKTYGASSTASPVSEGGEDVRAVAGGVLEVDTSLSQSLNGAPSVPPTTVVDKDDTEALSPLPNHTPSVIFHAGAGGAQYPLHRSDAVSRTPTATASGAPVTTVTGVGFPVGSPTSPVAAAAAVLPAPHPTEERVGLGGPASAMPIHPAEAEAQGRRDFMDAWNRLVPHP
jgi:hypothetical protein